jgi:excinuclease UvrABC nuclease subunit
MVFRVVGEKMHAVQMVYAKGFFGQKRVPSWIAATNEQEFLKAYYTTNQIPREILLNQPAGKTPKKKRRSKSFCLQNGWRLFL